MMRLAIVTLALGLAAAPSAAQEARISAGNPQGMVAALEAAGFSPKLEKDGSGDPKIEVEVSGYDTMIYFYGCDEATHDKCDAVQFSAGFDRAKPWNAAAAIDLAKKYRFTSVWLDDEGDPYVTWDVVTGEGIPTKVFLASVNHFGNALDNVAAATFAEQRAEGK